MMWTNIFRVLGLAITSIIAPFITAKYGQEAGHVVGAVGGLIAVQTKPIGKQNTGGK